MNRIYGLQEKCKNMVMRFQSPLVYIHKAAIVFFMPPKELYEAYSNRTVRLSRFVSGAYLLYFLR